MKYSIALICLILPLLKGNAQSLEMLHNRLNVGDSLYLSFITSSNELRVSPRSSNIKSFGLSFNSPFGQSYGGIRFTPDYSLVWSPNEIQFSTGNLNNNNQMTLSTTGMLGIQNPDPKFVLDLRSPNDTLASFKSTGFFSSSYLNVGNSALMGSRFNINGLTGLLSGAHIIGKPTILLQADTRADVFIDDNMTLMATDHNVTINPTFTLSGIGSGITKTFVPGIADLDVNSTIRSAELDFAEVNPTDKRPVFADKDGILRLGNAIGHKTVSHLNAVCQGDCDNFTLTSSIFYFTTDPSSYSIFIPVEFPDSVRVTEMTIYYFDNSSVSDISVELLSQSLTSSVPTSQFSYTTTGATSTFLRESTTTLGSFITDNENKRYWLEIESTNDIWDGANQRMGSIRFKYEII